jgi:excisionase family DNA binding protein
MEIEPNDQLLTAIEAGKRFRKTGQTMRLWARAGLIPAYKVGRAYLFRESDIQRLLAASEVGRGE